MTCATRTLCASTTAVCAKKTLLGMAITVKVSLKFVETRWSSGYNYCVLHFRSGLDRGFELGHDCRHIVSLDKKLYSTLSLFTQVYKWVRRSEC